ncbi:hypothetical protein L6164_033205 [Bauhinia variegata]|nr:hypothetical protein L6164_033205 [Bauhinia variegata]
MTFNSEPSCAPTSSWRVVETQEGWSMKTSANQQDIVPGWFKIQQYYGDYKLVFCPQYGFGCSNLGVYNDEDGNRRFVVNSERPLAVTFKSVDFSAI